MTQPPEFTDQPSDDSATTRRRPQQGAQRGAARMAVIRAFAERPGQVLFVTDLVEITGFTANQVRAAIYNARSTSEAVARDCEVIQRGTAWRWVAHPVASSTASMPDGDGDEPSQRRTRANARPTTRASRAATTDDEAENEQPQSSSPEFLELLSRLEDGDLLVRDHNNVVYRARRFQ